MNPDVILVEALPNYRLKLVFKNKEERVFDVTPYLEKGIFTELKDVSYFRRVKVSFGTVEWPNHQDFSKDTLYGLSAPVKK